jgi:hypothetical protein
MRGITGRLGLSRGRADLAILSRVLGVMHETAAGDLRGIGHAPALVGAAVEAAGRARHRLRLGAWHFRHHEVIAPPPVRGAGPGAGLFIVSLSGGIAGKGYFCGQPALPGAM